MTDEANAALRLLRQLMEKHPNASKAELIKLFSEAVKDDEEAILAMFEFWQRPGTATIIDRTLPAR